MIVGFGLHRAVNPPGRASIESVAVLPFENATGDPGNGYLGDGITESLTSALSRWSELEVASRASALRYKATGMDLREIGRALGVEAVLLGRVSQRGERLSISVELVNCADGRQLWGEQYSSRAADIFVVQADLAREALRALGRSLTAAEDVALRARDPRNLDAYRLYLRGRQRMDKRDRDGFSQAIADFREAVERDPNYAVAYVGLADAHSLMGYYRLRPPKESYEHARIAVLRALEIDGALAEAHASLAQLLTHYGWDWLAAEREYRRAIELDPRYAPARHWYSNYLSLMGRHDEAIAQATRAVELDPLSLSINSGALGNAYLQAGRYDEAIEQLRKALELDRNFGNAHVGLGLVYWRKGRLADALAEVSAATKLADNANWKARLGALHARMGRKNEARRILAELEPRQSEMMPVVMAALCAAVGEAGRAVAILEEAYEQRDPELPEVKTDPGLDLLRSDRRVQSLLRRIGLESE